MSWCMAHRRSAGSEYTIVAEAPQLLVTSLTPDEHGANANTVVSITGAGFLPGTQVAIVSDGVTIAAQNIQIHAFDRLTATFNLAGAPRKAFTTSEFRRPTGRPRLSRMASASFRRAADSSKRV